MRVWLLIPALALAACRGEERRAAAPVRPVVLGPESLAVVQTATVQAGPRLVGKLAPRHQATVIAELGGPVIETLVEAGERVQRGQLLARIDDAAVRDQLLAAKTSVRSAQTALALARLELERNRTLAQAGGLAVREVERAQAALSAQQAALAEAQARRAIAQQQLERTRVVASIDGAVSERRVSTGDVVTSGAPLYTIVDPTSMRLEGHVPAEQLAGIVVGAPVEFSVTGMGERRFLGSIERVSPAVDAVTGQVRLWATIPNSGGELLVGLYAEGRVATQEHKGLAAPATAVDLGTTPPTVMRIKNGAVERVPVEVGLRDDFDNAVELRAGLSAGDVLVLGGARQSLSEGAPVLVEGSAARVD